MKYNQIAYICKQDGVIMLYFEGRIRLGFLKDIF